MNSSRRSWLQLMEELNSMGATKVFRSHAAMGVALVANGAIIFIRCASCLTAKRAFEFHVNSSSSSREQH